MTRPATIIQSSPNTMPTACFAVQPRSFGTMPKSFDQHGCEWATDINHAYRIAHAWSDDDDGAEMIIWRWAHVGNGDPIPWVGVSSSKTSIPYDSVC